MAECAKNGQVVSNWLKIESYGIGRGKVCKHCDWSTKGNRKLVCGGCSNPFPKKKKHPPKKTAAPKRKAVAGHAIRSKKKKIKISSEKKSPPIIPAGVPFVGLKEFDSNEFGSVGFTPLLGSTVQDSIFSREDFLEMYSDVELPDVDFTTDDDCFEFFGSKNMYNEDFTSTDDDCFEFFFGSKNMYNEGIAV